MEDGVPAGASTCRSASARRVIALAMLVVSLLFGAYEHTHPLFSTGIGIDHGATSKPCPACASESNPGLASSTLSSLSAPEVLAVVEIPPVAEVSATIASATGRSPPCA